jgi:hypothetical protein
MKRINNPLFLFLPFFSYYINRTKWIKEVIMENEKLTDNEIITEVEDGIQTLFNEDGIELLVEDGEVENVSN